jgi:hypothetical protein
MTKLWRQVAIAVGAPGPAFIRRFEAFQAKQKEAVKP